MELAVRLICSFPLFFFMKIEEKKAIVSVQTKFQYTKNKKKSEGLYERCLIVKSIN